MKEDRRSFKGKKKGRAAPEKGIAKLFMHGRSQAVRLPAEFRLPGDKVRVRRVEGGGILLEPLFEDVDAWFAEMDKYKHVPFPDRPEQPPMPEEKDLFD